MSNEIATPNNDRPRGGDGHFVRTIETAERDAEACRLRSRGYSYRRIGRELGINEGTAHRAVRRALEAVVVEPAADVIAFELRRLDDELVRLDEMYNRVRQVLEREHVTVSQGRVVEHDGVTVPDDDWILRAVDRLVKIDESRRRNGESRRRLLGLDSPVKTQISGGLTYEIVGVNTEALT